tara:strand:- start:52 stop:267 length:216 start_codon:yes stop_codon:yes gene_type:complete
VEIIHRNDKDLESREREYVEKFANPYPAAERGFIDDVIVPEKTRTIIASDLEILRTKSIENPKKKHGNIPL